MPANKSIEKALDMIAKDKSKVLGVKVGKHIVEPGLYIPKAEAQEDAIISFNVPDTTKSYVVVALDLDAPFQTVSILGPIIHGIQSGYRTSTDNDASNVPILKTQDPFVVDYIGPAPPPPSGPHRYSFYLYEEPAGYDAKALAPPHGAKFGMFGRMRFSLDDWEKKHKAGPVLAANYFTSN